ncbi:MAG: hypothetical protein ACM31C_18110 [Acidobacteriota bacterium]
MADDLAWTFDFTRERVPGLQVQLEWALQHQNQRFVQSFVAGTWGVRRVLVTVLCAFGALLDLAVLVIDPAVWRSRWLFFAAFLMLFAMLPIVIARQRPRPDRRRSQRRVGARLARTAERIYRRPRARAPYTIAYTFDGAGIRARVESLGLDRAFELRRPRLVIATPELLLAFRRSWSVTPFRFVYVTPEARGALLAACSKLGVPTVELAGPVEGYVAPLPDARAR